MKIECYKSSGGCQQTSSNGVTATPQRVSLLNYETECLCFTVLKKHDRSLSDYFQIHTGEFGRWKVQNASVMCKGRKRELEKHTWVAKNTFYPLFSNTVSDWSAGIHL